MFKKVSKTISDRMIRIQRIKYLIATNQYNLEEAIEATAEKIVEHPETLAWS